MRSHVLVACLRVACLALLPGICAGATLEVGSGKAYATPTAAMAAAHAGDLIRIFSSATFTVASPIVWVDGVRMEAAPTYTPTISGGDASRCVRNDTTVTYTDYRNSITGVTFTHGAGDGSGGGAIYFKSGHLRLANCTFTSNTARGFGGAVHLKGTHGSWFVTDCAFTGNSVSTNGVSTEGGALCIEGGADTVWVQRCTFASNSITDPGTGGIGFQGGGLSIQQCPLSFVLDCTFTSNQARASGALHVWQGSNMASVVRGCTFTSNTATSTVAPTYCFAGAFYADHTMFTVQDCLFSQNTAKGAGGGLYMHANAGSSVTRCQFIQNTAGQGAASGVTGFGGGANIIASSVDVTYCRFSLNSAQKGGGLAIGTAAASLTPGACAYNLFDQNTTGSFTNGGGGAVFVSQVNGSTFAPDHCTFVDNTCTAVGRASCIQDSAGALVTATDAATNCIFSNNTTGAVWTKIGVGTVNHTAGCSQFNANTSNGTWTMTDCLTTAVNYLDRPNHDYRLSGTSPAWSQHATHPANCAGVTWGYYPWCAGGEGCWIPADDPPPKVEW